MTLKQALSDFPDDLKFLDESERLAQKHEQGLEDLKKFISGNEITASYNDALMQIIENRKLLEQKINALEKKVDMLDKNSKSRADNIVKTLFDIANDIFLTSFKFLYDKFFG